MNRRMISKGISIVTVGIACVAGLLLLTTGCPMQPGGGGGGGGDGGTGNSGVTGKFAGEATCAQCHPTVHDEWSETLHAGALATLEAIGQGSNAVCLPCHTVGFGEQGGYVDRATTNILANVQCENCHGAAADHAANPGNASLRPEASLSASVCGQCHQGSHHPNFEQWGESAHSGIDEHVAENVLLAGGSAVNNCGACHSGDVFFSVNVKGEAVEEEAFVGLTAEDLTPITCAVCHNPHERTGHAATPEDGRDYQLRFRQVASPTPSNTIEDVTNPQRFNICGQCHHSRGRTWTSTTRGPHHSIQSNVYVGEMPVDDIEEEEPLVLGRTSVHSFAPEQCSTCHMYREDFQSEQAPAISGHDFAVNNAGCAASGCHPSSDAAIAAQATLQTEVETRLEDIAARLGDPSTWEYSAEGGPEDQSGVSDEVKQIRYLYHYTISDGSLGVHNPDYVRSMLEKAEELLDIIGQ